MKKLLLFFAMILLPKVANADAVEIDGIYYNLISKSNEAKVINHPIRYAGKITIPATVNYEGLEYKVTTIQNKAFYMSSITSISIGSNVETIESNAFAYCAYLTSVYINDLSIWCNIKFSGKESNPLYDYDHTYNSRSLYVDEKKIIDLIIPNNVTSINDYAFIGCSDFKSITIPNSVVSIGDGSFYGCSGLTNINIPDGVETIGSRAFAGCSSLKSISIPSNVKSISEETFISCRSLVSVTIPNSVNRISRAAFFECTNLPSITIPSSVKTIGPAAFKNCYTLKEVTIEKGIETIENEAFAYSQALENIYCHATNVPNTNIYAFRESYTDNITLHVPANSVNAYKAVEPWKNFKEIVSLEGGDTPDPQKCEKPIISYVNGQLKMSCATEGVKYVTDITDADIKKYNDATITLTATYNISVYATKSGYDNSETATATLCWIDVQPKTEGITNTVANVRALPLLIQSNGSTLTVSGADDGTPITVYSINGTEAGSSISQNGAATIPTTLQFGSAAIVKVGNKAIKVVIK